MTEAFLRAVRRRLRLAWAVATGQLVVPAALGAAVLLTVAGRLRPIGWADPAALAAVCTAVVGLAAAALSRRVPLSVAARAADRGLGTHDAFATALEVGGGPLADRVHERAGSLARGRTAREAVRLQLQPRRLAVSGLLLVTALGLGVLPNPQDVIARQRAAEQALLGEQAQRLSQAAADLQISAGGRARRAAVKELERAARELRAAPGVQAGRRALDQAAARLTGRIDPNLLGMKAAVRGLDRSLAAVPLPGIGAGTGTLASAQLSAAARSLPGLAPEQRSALADRLGTLAEAQQQGDPRTARALGSAAGALRNGDLAAAAGALSQAGTEHARTQGDVQDQEGAAGALGSLALSAGALAEGPGARTGQTGPGGLGGRDQGHAQGAAEEQSSGLGLGSGRGQGSGRGSGQGSGGSGAGRVTGNNAVTGGGQGGAGTAGGTGHNATVGVQTATVYDPATRSTEGEQLGVQGRSGSGSGQVIGQGDLTQPADAPLTPLVQAFPRYQVQASEALSRLDIPPAMRAVVRAYFESLDPR
jgi:hypothetical protein